MPQIIPPRHTTKKKAPELLRWIYLFVGIAALLWGFFLLIDIALGLFLLMLGFAMVHQWMVKR